MPRGARSSAELIRAHFRPQPAIPAVAVLMLSVMFAASSATDPTSLALWLVGAGIFASCGLAIAAGFCSFFPPLAWIVLALVFLSSRGAWVGTTPVRVAFYSGLAAAAGMLMVQAWRVQTGRFVPTIEEASVDSRS
jgi:hypothetical protein